MKFIEIPLTKCTVFLSEKEITSLLMTQPDLFKEGLRRGKAIKRARNYNSRQRESHK